MRAMFLALALLAVPLSGCAADEGSVPGDTIEPAERPTATLVTNLGTIEIELFADLTPQTVKNFGTLAQQAFYDGVKFHRVIEGFMIQGGDPNTKEPESASNRWGGGGPGYTILDEFVCNDMHYTNDHPANCSDHGGFLLAHSGPGILSMANTGQPRSGGSQFFLTLDPTPHLNGRHTVFGRVIEGMDVVREIGSTSTECSRTGLQEPRCSSQPDDPVIIESVRITGELPSEELQTFR